MPKGRASGVWVGWLICAAVACEGARAQGTGGAEYRDYIAELDKNLKQAIVSFWAPRCIDRENGGYRIDFDAEGKPAGTNDKMIVTQARMVWLFSRLAREGYEPEKNLATAEHGYRFLRDRMWDPKNGGFYWEVDATGTRHLMPDKHLYGQSFGLYALAEYARASKRREPLDMANKLFELLEARAHDGTFGGYRESFREDWSEFASGESSYMGLVEFKLMNTHLHLLEAMATYYAASGSAAARERLLELINIESNAVVRKGVAGATDKYKRDWTPVLTDDYARVSYGHDLENIWLLVEASRAARISTWPFVDLYRAVFENALTYGFDEQMGGFFDSGRFREKADRREKTWWVQAEALVSSLYMYQLTHDRKYWDVFTRTYGFVDWHQTDWGVGEWFETVEEDGTPKAGEKGTIWKAGYHNGRAMLEGMAVLRELAAQR